MLIVDEPFYDGNFLSLKAFEFGESDELAD
jgi:hypothetical protein